MQVVCALLPACGLAGGRGWSDQGKDGTAVLIRDQWVGNSEYRDCLDPTATGELGKSVKKEGGIIRLLFFRHSGDSGE